MSGRQGQVGHPNDNLSECCQQSQATEGVGAQGLVRKLRGWPSAVHGVGSPHRTGADSIGGEGVMPGGARSWKFTEYAARERGQDLRDRLSATWHWWGL